ncbi:MAG: shikimate dehydrogenase [Rhodospirillales bacterium]|nr:shikimate dehydrogenase [Rhodospirillales bacterium]
MSDGTTSLETRSEESQRGTRREVPQRGTRLAGVIGWPIDHSLSPRLHGFWLKAYGIDGAYIPMAVRAEDLAEALAALPKLGFRGVNITVPHKERALRLVHAATSVARRIGAVNTIWIDADGKLTGDNSDAFGFLENLRESVPGWEAERRASVVLGAGGAARAVTFALHDCGAPEIRIVNRSFDRSQQLANDIGSTARPVPWAERAAALDGAGLLVNATVLGMRNHAPLDLDLSLLPRDAVVYDIVYVPLRTPLLVAGEQRGNPVVGGLGMLLHQARPGFSAWFGRMPDVTADLRALLTEGVLSR